METGYNTVSDTLATEYIGSAAANANSSWLDAIGTNGFGKCRLLLQWASASGNNNFTIEASNNADHSSAVLLAKPTVSAAGTHLLDVVELPTGSYRYYRVKNAAGSAATVHVVAERYNPRREDYQGDVVAADKGNIYRYTGAVA